MMRGERSALSLASVGSNHSGHRRRMEARRVDDTLASDVKRCNPRAFISLFVEQERNHIVNDQISRHSGTEIMFARNVSPVICEDLKADVISFLLILE